MESTNPSPNAITAPRPAATLVILRDSPEGLEVLLTLRPKSLRFMGGATVFPGGAVSEQDLDPRLPSMCDVSRTEASRDLEEPDGTLALGYYVAAVREAFEEVGFESSYASMNLLLTEDPRENWLHEHMAGSVIWTSKLVPAGRWVTPHGSNVRFDTRFFVTLAPDGWKPSPDPREVERAHWSSPAAALEELAQGRSLMAPPTAAMLQKLERYSSASEALAGLSGSGLQAGELIYRVRLSPLVQVALAPNPGIMTGPGTNTYVLGSGPTAIVDPAVDDQDYIESVLEAAGDVSTILVTHRHSDHVGGAAVLANHTGAPVRAWGDAPAGDASVQPLIDGEILEIGGMSPRAIFSPGHAADHVSFWLPEEDSLIAGDNVLGEGTSVIAPPDGDMKAYLDSLRRLEELHPRRIYPGHFRPLDDGTKVIAGYIRHRLEREQKIVAALANGPVTLEEVVTKAYDDTPVQLHPAAQMSALAHLESLEKDGRVRRLSQSWELVGIE